MKNVLTKEYAVSAAELWKIFGAYDKWSEWSEVLETSVMDNGVEVGKGATRTCEKVGGGQSREEITHYDAEKMELSYLILAGLPGFMKRVENVWVITPINDTSCRITSNTDITLAWYMLPLSPLLKLKIKGSLKMFMGFLENAALNKKPFSIDNKVAPVVE